MRRRSGHTTVWLRQQTRSPNSTPSWGRLRSGGFGGSLTLAIRVPQRVCCVYMCSYHHKMMTHICHKGLAPTTTISPPTPVATERGMSCPSAGGGGAGTPTSGGRRSHIHKIKVPSDVGLPWTRHGPSPAVHALPRVPPPPKKKTQPRGLGWANFQQIFGGTCLCKHVK